MCGTDGGGGRFHPHRTRPKWLRLHYPRYFVSPIPCVVASPHTCGRKRKTGILFSLFLSRFEALVRRFVRLGESTCSTASRVRSAARCLCNRVGMKFTIGTNPGSATISTAAAAAASVPTTYAARFRGNRNPGSFVHFVNTSRGYVPPGIGVFVWKILFTKFSLANVTLRGFAVFGPEFCLDRIYVPYTHL